MYPYPRVQYPCRYGYGLAFRHPQEYPCHCLVGEISPLSRVSSKRGDGGLEIKHIPSVLCFKPCRNGVKCEERVSPPSQCHAVVPPKVGWLIRTRQWHGYSRGCRNANPYPYPQGYCTCGYGYIPPRVLQVSTGKGTPAGTLKLYYK